MAEYRRYRMQIRFQDSGWEYEPDDFDYCGDAICRASELSEQPGLGAMARVIDTHATTNEGFIVITYAGGGGVIREK